MPNDLRQVDQIQRLQVFFFDVIEHASSMAEVETNIQATWFVLLVGTMTCHHCQAQTEVGAVLVRDFDDLDEQAMDPYGAALLGYIQLMNAAALEACQHRLPHLRYATTQTYGSTYLANHCQACGFVQGDHFVHGPDGPFWPNEEDDPTAIEVVLIEQRLVATADLSQASWMDQISS